jgi:hypothetical protein
MHTPGPWITADNTNTSNFVYALSGRGFNRMFLSVYTDKKEGAMPGEVEADARLIAAAPEMLAALKDARQQIIALCSPNDVPDSVTDAINKAEGR